MRVPGARRPPMLAITKASLNINNSRGLLSGRHLVSLSQHVSIRDQYGVERAALQLVNVNETNLVIN